jgi:hypothetical protein
MTVVIPSGVEGRKLVYTMHVIPLRGMTLAAHLLKREYGAISDRAVFSHFYTFATQASSSGAKRRRTAGIVSSRVVAKDLPSYRHPVPRPSSLDYARDDALGITPVILSFRHPVIP